MKIGNRSALTFALAAAALLGYIAACVQRDNPNVVDADGPSTAATPKEDVATPPSDEVAEPDVDRGDELAQADAAAPAANSGDIIHDAEYYILKAKNGERWAAEDEQLNKKLAALKAKHGTPPNIVYIL